MRYANDMVGGRYGNTAKLELKQLRILRAKMTTPLLFIEEDLPRGLSKRRCLEAIDSALAHEGALEADVATEAFVRNSISHTHLRISRYEVDGHIYVETRSLPDYRRPGWPQTAR